MQDEAKVAYTRLVSVSVDEPGVICAFRAALDLPLGGFGGDEGNPWRVPADAGTEADRHLVPYG